MHASPLGPLTARKQHLFHSLAAHALAVTGLPLSIAAASSSLIASLMGVNLPRTVCTRFFVTCSVLCRVSWVAFVRQDRLSPRRAAHFALPFPGQRAPFASHPAAPGHNLLTCRHPFFGGCSSSGTRATAAPLLASQAPVPIRVDAVLRHVTVQVWRTIVPPDGTSLSERALGDIDLIPCGAFDRRVTSALCCRNRSARIHQLPNKFHPFFFAKSWIGHSPKAAPYDEVAPVRRYGMLRCRLWHPRFTLVVRTHAFTIQRPSSKGRPWRDGLSIVSLHGQLRRALPPWWKPCSDLPRTACDNETFGHLLSIVDDDTEVGWAIPQSSLADFDQHDCRHPEAS